MGGFPAEQSLSRICATSSRRNSPVLKSEPYDVTHANQYGHTATCLAPFREACHRPGAPCLRLSLRLRVCYAVGTIAATWRIPGGPLVWFGGFRHSDPTFGGQRPGSQAVGSALLDDGPGRLVCVEHSLDHRLGWHRCPHRYLFTIADRGLADLGISERGNPNPGSPAGLCPGDLRLLKHHHLQLLDGDNSVPALCG